MPPNSDQSPTPLFDSYRTAAPQLRRAAQYIRMSTDHQKYSIDNQADLISAYAAIHEIEIVRTYLDAGRSGLRSEGRDAFQKIIDDVQNGNADYNLILVYDISRWGRFQDTDEAAHYEFLCKRGGVEIKYCAEQFDNDSGLLATIAKGLKRAMAAEFSRELSSKTFQGHKRLAKLGFRQGATPGFGLRRLIVDEQKRPKFILNFGEQKHLQTQHVVLTPGPPDEVELVREMFRMFVDQHIPVKYVAQRLNERGSRNAWGNPWTTNNVFKVLRNESYIGTLVYNRTTQALMTKRRPNPKQSWIRTEGAFEAIVDPDLFASAQKLLNSTWRFTDNELLDYLTAALCSYGRLSTKIIRERRCGPSYGAYVSHFGNLTNAFHAIGYAPRTKSLVGDPTFKRGHQRLSRKPMMNWKHSDFRFRPLTM